MRPVSSLSAALVVGLALAASAGPAPRKPAPPVRPGMAMTRGSSPTVKVEVVAFLGYQCPFSARGYATLAGVLETYGADVSLTVVQRPLPHHPDGRAAALAALAAARQGKFWEMSEALFADREDLGAEALVRRAGELGLDATRLEQDMKSPDLLAALERAGAIAEAVYVRGTPTFFINGMILQGAQPAEKFNELVDGEIAAARKARKQGPRWVQARTRQHNADLHGYLYANKAPPEKKPPAPASP